MTRLTETVVKRKLWRRMRLRRANGEVYLDRWGIAHDRLGGVLLHRMESCDPGQDLHDHPWWFTSFVLWGGYREQRAPIRVASGWAARGFLRGTSEYRDRWSWRVMRLDECHRIVELYRPVVWTLVVRGPARRPWGFYCPDGYVGEREYDLRRRDMWNELG